MYTNGWVHFEDDRVTDTIAFAHVADLHLPPVRAEAWPDKYRHAIEWWDTEFEHPNEVFPRLLDEIKSVGIDFVFFAGDNLDHYDPPTADYLVTACRQRGLACYFQLGNHDFEDTDIRYVTHDNDDKVRSENGAKLFGHWGMPERYYSFEKGKVRFVVLDTPYKIVEGGFAGCYDKKQVDWFVDQLKYNGPIVVFYHIPFKLPSNEFRYQLAWNGVKGWIADDENSRLVVSAIENCPNILGMFAGHTHIRHEDPIGNTAQFVTAAGYMRQWRYVKICNLAPPKSLLAPGRPAVAGDGGPSMVGS